MLSVILAPLKRVISSVLQSMLSKYIKNISIEGKGSWL